jgi:predicted phage terminase large subunit-like protein
MDDLIKDRAQADSPVYRDSLIDWYKSVARTRLQPGGAIVLIQTRWGSTDFVSWLLAETRHENWEVISLPAMALEYDPLGRQPGEALWPEAYPLPTLEETRATLGSRDWNALYQQCPLDDADVIFTQKWLRFYDKPPFIMNPRITHSWDLSFGGLGATSSWVVGQVWAYDEDTRHSYLLAMTREQLGFSGSIAAIRDLNKRYPANQILVEAKANGPAVIETLKSEIPYLEPVMPQGGKVDRAYACCPTFERGQVFFPNPKDYPWVQPLLTELETFPASIFDDCIDSMTQYLVYLQNYREPFFMVSQCRW